jgi:hypothetical protein
MNRSTPLSADARRLLELGSHVEPPTAEQDERMERALAPLFRTGRPAPFALEGAGAPTRAPTPAAGSPLGGAEQRAANLRRRADHEATHGSPHEHERSGVRLRAAPRALPAWLGPLQGLRDAKIWLTIGALAATASASFWLGRLSTPAELASVEVTSFEVASVEVVSAGLAPPLHARPAETVVAPPAEAAPALASASLAASPLDAPELAVSGQAESSQAESSQPVSSQPPSTRAPSVPDAASGDGAVVRTSLPRGGTRAHRSLGLAAEIEQLARAEAALRQGRAGHALVVLGQRSVRHLQEQAAALRAIAECELGVATAAGSAREVLERWPTSAFEPRIARACLP